MKCGGERELYHEENLANTSVGVSGSALVVPVIVFTPVTKIICVPREQQYHICCWKRVKRPKRLRKAI